MAKKSKVALAAPAMDQDWQASSDADTLARAAEIMADKPRFAKAKEYHAKRQEQMDKLVSGLRRKA